MKIIVGLGNPGKDYEKTRHNVGFMTIDELARQYRFYPFQAKFRGEFLSGLIEGEKIILFKPMTYMNLSGEAIIEILQFYQLNAEALLVIYDDLDLPTGKIRLREMGSSGGHNGIKSIIQHLKTDTFNRIKIGINRPPKGYSISDYVLSGFATHEIEEVKKGIDLAVSAVNKSLQEPFLKIMNDFN